MSSNREATRSYNRRALAAVAAAVVVVLAACATKRSESQRGGTTEKDQPATQARAGDGKEDNKPTDGAKAAHRDTRKVIRTGRVDLVVAAYDKARDKLDALVAAAGGYVDSTQIARGQGATSSATIVLRVPAANFGTFIPKLRELGDVRAESTTGQDITDEYVDVAARLASERTLEKRLLELATARTGTIDQVLAVERELANVRGQIESYETRIKQWDDHVATSTLTVELTTKAPELAAAAAPSLSERTSDALHASVAALRDFAAWLVISCIALLPWLVLIVPALLLGRRLVRRARLPRAIAKS